jgi:hypothetical protein
MKKSSRPTERSSITPNKVSFLIQDNGEDEKTKLNEPDESKFSTQSREAFEQDRYTDSVGISKLVNAKMILYPSGYTAESSATRVKLDLNELMNYRSNRFKFNQHYLRILFIFLICVAFLLSFLTFMPIAITLKGFSYQCPLFSKIDYKLVQMDSNETLVDVNFKNSIWGSELVCQYSFCVGVLTVCYCVMSMFFFIMFNMKDLIENDYCLLMPWITITSVYTVMIFICACLITNGFSALCDTLVTQHHEKNVKIYNLNPHEANKYLTECRRAQLYKWKKIDSSGFYDNLTISAIASWLLFVDMIFIDIVILIRILIIYKNLSYQQDEDLQRCLIYLEKKKKLKRIIKNLN